MVKQADSVAVVADTWWQAKKAAEMLPVSWDVGDNGGVSSGTIREEVCAGLSAADARVGRSDGDVDRALALAARRIEADYEVPFLAHATMEPQNCTAHVTAEHAEIWAPTQDGETALAIAADASGLPPGKVVVHKMMLGCGFGRRGIFQDFVRQAVLIAKEVGQPVKLVWTREEDIRHDFYRPVAAARMTGGLDADGTPIAWKLRTAGQSIIAAVSPRVMQFGVDRNFLQGLLEDMPYDVPNYRVDFAMRNTHVPVGVWRSVNHSQNAFFKEGFVDERMPPAATISSGAGSWRRSRSNSRSSTPWRPRPNGARHCRRASFAASPSMIAEQHLRAGRRGFRGKRRQGARAARRIGDRRRPCGQSADGRIADGKRRRLRPHRALYGEITITNGQVEQSNFNDYPMLRLADMPRVETVIIASGGFWGGVGETPVHPCARLVQRDFLRHRQAHSLLPLKNHDLRKA